MTPMRYIRKVVFGLNQAEFADLVGRTQATVSRWESGTAPSLDDMRAIRDAALRRSIPWNDDWFFDVPDTGDDDDGHSSVLPITTGEPVALAAEPVAQSQRPTAIHARDFDTAIMPQPMMPNGGVVAGPVKPSQAGTGPSHHKIQETAE